MQKPSSKATGTSEFQSLEDLWQRFTRALADPSLGTTYLLVSGLDQLDIKSRKAFLGLFKGWEPPDLYDEDGSAPVVKWFFFK